MAKATKRTREVRKTVTEVVSDGVTLTLTQREAETLRMIAGRVGGDPLSTRRGDMDAISVALSLAGVVKPNDPYPYTGSDELQGSLTFRTTKDAFVKTTTAYLNNGQITWGIA